MTELRESRVLLWMGTEGVDVGTEWRWKREAVGDPRLEKESRNGGRKPGTVAKDGRVCRGVGGLSGL